MEGDKEAYLDEATKALRRQRKIIEDLDREKSDLERSLRTAKSRQNSRRDGENAAKIARLAEEQVGKKIIFSFFFFLLGIRRFQKKINFNDSGVPKRRRILVYLSHIKIMTSR